MKCMECGAEIENGTYACEYCAARFSEEDVQVMLLLESRARKKRVRKGILLTLLIIALIFVIVGGSTYFVAKFLSEKKEAMLVSYKEGVNNYLSSLSNIDSYEFGDESLIIYVHDEIWESLSENERIEFGQRIQNATSLYKKDIGINDGRFIVVQINDEFDNILLYADDVGNVSTFELPF